MFTNIRLWNYVFFILFSFLGITACVDQEFDEPPVTDLPKLTANTTIADLKARHTTGENDRLIDGDVIIEGVVIADDRSGNFYKALVIQDATGGIEIRINSIGLYNEFPIGRKMFVRCKGLFLGDYNGVVQINGSPEAGIEEVLIPEHLFGAERDQPLTPKTVTLEELDQNLVSTLIRLESVQFVDDQTGVAFADPVNRLSINRRLEDCQGNTIELRTSGFADFAGEPTPSGSGSITAVYSIFGTSKQLYIRDLTDLQMDGDRCQAFGNTTGIQEVRSWFSSGQITVPQGKTIKGVVISDKANGNSDGRNLYLQDGSGGIVIRFPAVHNFSLGEEVEVNISGQALSEFRGLLQVNLEDNGKAVSVGTGVLPAPREATVSQILANLENWESTLVLIKGVTISGSSSFNGTTTLKDPSGSVDLYTRGDASFSGRALPSGQVDIVAVVSQFNNPQLFIRSLEDISGYSESHNNGPLEELNETFESQSDNQDINLSGWLNLATSGTRVWRAREFDNNLYAQATAFGDNNAQMESWLITPPIDLRTAKILSFVSAQAFFVHDGLSVWISTDFDGKNTGSASWTQLTATLANSSSAANAWVASGPVDLSAFEGTGYIGFKYIGNKDSGTTTFRIDNVKIINK